MDMAVPLVKKSSRATQCALQLRCSSTQTQESFKIPRISNSVAVQTVAAPVDSLEISSIQGVLPVTHSTPNEGSLVRTVARNLRKKKEGESRDGFGYQLHHNHDQSPEVLRDPFVSRVTQSVLSDKIPRIPDLRDLESGGPKKVS